MAAYGRYIDFDTLRNQKNENTRTSATGSGSSTTAHARTRTREERLQEEFLRVLEYAAEALQLRPGRVLQEDVRDALLDGISSEVLIACVQEAELAPRPSWGYARAVIRRCRQSRICTPEDWEADKNRWGSRKNAGFSQREERRDWGSLFVSFSADEEN